MFFSALDKSVTQPKSLLKAKTYGLSLEIAVCQLDRGTGSVCEHFTDMRWGVHRCHKMHLTPPLLWVRSLGMARYCGSADILELMELLRSVTLLSTTTKAKKQIIFIMWALLPF